MRSEGGVSECDFWGLMGLFSQQALEESQREIRRQEEGKEDEDLRVGDPSRFRRSVEGVNLEM